MSVGRQKLNSPSVDLIMFNPCVFFRVWVNGSFTKKLCDSKLELPKQTVIGKSLKSHSVEEVLLEVTKMVSSFSKEL